MTAAPPRLAAIACAAAGALALGVALGSEYYGELVPCALCLLERWPYRVAIAIGLLAAVVPRVARAFLIGAGVLTFAVAAGLAFTHVGVEQGFWPSPLPECAAPRIDASTVAGRLRQMPALPSKPCDDPTYLIPGVPVSMAAMNLLFALALTGLLAMWMTVGADRGRRE